MTVVLASDFTGQSGGRYYIHVAIYGHESGTGWSFEIGHDRLVLCPHDYIWS